MERNGEQKKPDLKPMFGLPEAADTKDSQPTFRPKRANYLLRMAN
jgi:hypothetical protein